jgi:NAD(P)-dependent dehydrogenase (short-subunit alcohol dehydrogenase family)
MGTDPITGANRGIGYAYCQQLQARGDHPMVSDRSRSIDPGEPKFILLLADGCVENPVASLKSNATPS